MSGERETPLPGSGFKEAYVAAQTAPKRPTLRPVPKRKPTALDKEMVKDPAWQARARRDDA